MDNVKMCANEKIEKLKHFIFRNFLIQSETIITTCENAGRAKKINPRDHWTSVMKTFPTSLKFQTTVKYRCPELNDFR